MAALDYYRKNLKTLLPFLHMAAEQEREKYPQIIHIPEGRYLCQKVADSRIDRIWEWVPEFVAENQIQCVIETELFTGRYYFSDPVLELRCRLYE